MPGFFEAFANLPPPKKVIPKVTLDGKVFEVSVEKFQQIMKYGLHKFHVKNNEIVMKPRPKARLSYAKLEKSEKGYRLLDSNMFWPTEIVNGGYKWTQ
jgi:hypothetical protein